MKCRVLDIQTLHLKVMGPSGAGQMALSPVTKIPAMIGYREVECENEEEEVDEGPMEAAGGIGQEGLEEASPARETQNNASQEGDYPNNH